MITQKTVSGVLKELSALGLEVRKETGSGHYKIHDPVSGAWLFNVSHSPSDTNWHYNIRRHLRRLGWESVAYGPRRGMLRVKKVRGVGAIDLEALAKAQSQAAAAGERIPQLDDLSELPHALKKTTSRGGGYVVSAQQEALKNMAPRADAPRIHRTKNRLEKFLEKYGSQLESQAKQRLIDAGKKPSIREGQGSRSEFVRVAMYEVAPARALRTWKSEASGQQTIATFLKDGGSASLWAINLMEATMDHIEGLRWDTKPLVDDFVPEHIEPEPVDTVEDEPEPEAELPESVPAPFDFSGSTPAPKEYETTFEAVASVDTRSSLRERYADVLLNLLSEFVNNGMQLEHVTAVMDRLDKLVGLDD